MALWAGLGWLYLIQAAQLLLPLVSMPFLARTLGPQAWGRVAAAQGFAMLAGLFVEYGFNLSGTRRVARCREDAPALRRAFSALLTAQLALLAAACSVAMLARPWVPFLAQDPALAAAALLWMVPQVVSLQWYFQGVERMPWLTGWILAGRVLGLAGLLACVAGPRDAALSLALPGGAGLLALVLAGTEPWRRLRPGLATMADTREVLGEGAGLCLYRLGIALQGAANTFLLALWWNPAAVGLYAGVERLARAALGLLEPLLVTVFPRVAFLLGDGRGDQAGQAERRGVVSILAGGLTLGVVLAGAAPWLVSRFLGPAYAGSADVLRVLAFWPLGHALCQMRGLNGLAARGRDRLLTVGVIVAGALQLAGVALLSVAPAPLEWVAAWMVAGQFLQWSWLEYLSARRA